MIATYCVLILSFVYITNCEDGYVPPYITPCDFNANKKEECIKEQIEIALPKFSKGIPEMNIASIDPVKVKDIKIDGAGLKMLFSDVNVYGYSKSILKDLKLVSGKRLKTVIIAFKCDVQLKAKYVIDGKILTLPIQGNGDAVVDTRDVIVTLSSNFVHYKDDAGEHLKFDKTNYNYTIESTKFDMTNLFNGNKELAEATLKFANDNWQILMDDLAPPIIKQICNTIIKTINKFFSKVTIHQIIKNYPDA